MAGNDHGWTELGQVKAIGGLEMAGRGFSMSFAPIVGHACSCPTAQCARRVTQEDGLCDECRETCTSDG